MALETRWMDSVEIVDAFGHGEIGGGGGRCGLWVQMSGFRVSFSSSTADVFHTR